MKKKTIGLSIFVLSLLSLLFIISSVQASSFYGYVKFANTTAMNGTNVTVNFYDMGGQGPTLNSTYSNLSDTNGLFNFTDISPSGQFFDIEIRHYNDTTNKYADYVGSNIPMFDLSMFDRTNNLTFYMQPAATINISAENATGAPIGFQYQIKDTSLGYPLSQNFASDATNALMYVPIGRNYSVMIYPNMTFPVSKDITTLDINSSSRYFTYTFNTSVSFQRLEGYAMQPNGTIGGFDDLHVVSYLLEPGRMVYMGDNSMAMYNFTGPGGTGDIYNASSGEYNISVIGPAENGSIISFIVGQLGSDYYGAFKEIHLSYGADPSQTNVTLQKLSGKTTDISAGFPPGNITLNLSKEQFQILNNDGTVFTGQAHIEVVLDYEDWNMTNFTMMLDTSNSDNGTFSIPLLNMTGVQKINVFSQDGSPLKKQVSASDLNSDTSINLSLNSALKMEKPDGNNLSGSLFVDMIKDNAACNVPNYNATNCSYFGGEKEQDAVDPFSVVMSGAPITFVMRNSLGITVMYENVDMLASGPPDALFDDSATNKSTSSVFQQAWRFGSTGPDIYDSVIIGVPYNAGSSSATGFNDSEPMNITVPYLYGDDFSNPLWNGSANSNNISEIGNFSNLSDFTDYIGNAYEAYINGTGIPCNESDSNLSSGLCYKDTTDHILWFKIPHFSGIGPSIVGDVITATSTPPASSGGGGGGGGGAIPTTANSHSWTKITPGAATIMKDFDSSIGLKQIAITVNNAAQNVEISVTKYDSKPANVSVAVSGNVYQYMHIDTENLTENLSRATLTFRVNKTWVNSNGGQDNVSVYKIEDGGSQWTELNTTYDSEDSQYDYYNATVTSFSYFAIAQTSVASNPETTTQQGTQASSSSLWWLWLIIAVAIVVAFVLWLARKRPETRASSYK